MSNAPYVSSARLISEVTNRIIGTIERFPARDMERTARLCPDDRIARGIIRPVIREYEATTRDMTARSILIEQLVMF